MSLQLNLQPVLSALNSARKAIVIDTETNITDFWEERWCMGISLCIDGECFYLPVRHDEWGKGQITSVGDVSGLLDNIPDVPVVFHNAKFDIRVLEKVGIKVPTENMYDTMIMAHLIDEEYLGKATSFELDALCRHYLGIRKEMDLSKAMQQWVWEQVPVTYMAKYAEQDARATYQLFFCLKAKFGEFEDVWKIDREFLLLLMEIETRGVKLNRAKVSDELQRVEQWCADYKAKLGFDPGKKKLLQDYVFGTLGLKPLTFTPKTNAPQINTNFLEKTNHPFCKEFREFKQQEKLLTSYLRPYLRLAPTGRFHANYRQHGTVTGRLSCFDPNMQQIPRQSAIKSFFQPEDGCELWEIDYRTLEFRLAAVYAQQQNLLDVFRVDGDTHQLTADLLGIDRQRAKTINFAIIYGAGRAALAYQLDIPEEQAASILSDWRKAYPNIYKKSLEAGQVCEANLGKIKLWSGRYRHFHHRNDFHKAWNALIQGGGFQIVKVSMLELRKAGFDMRNQVHDSVWLNINPVQRSVESQIAEAESIMADWTQEAFGLKFSVESKRLA